MFTTFCVIPHYHPLITLLQLGVQVFPIVPMLYTSPGKQKVTLTTWYFTHLNFELTCNGTQDPKKKSPSSKASDNHYDKGNVL